MRAGLHTGEIELFDQDVGGIAVHIGARVTADAAPSEILVSSTVKDLVAGSGIEFDDRGVLGADGLADLTFPMPRAMPASSWIWGTVFTGGRARPLVGVAVQSWP